MTDEEKEKYLKLNVPKPEIVGEFEISKEDDEKYSAILMNLVEKSKNNKRNYGDCLRTPPKSTV